ncbi:hypothetical protein ACQ4PT_002483 [Festuca glaucescens]
MADWTVSTTVSSPSTGMEHVGYLIRPSDMDSHVASLWPTAISIEDGYDFIIQRHTRRNPDGATSVYGLTTAQSRAAERLARRYRYSAGALFGYGRAPGLAPGPRPRRYVRSPDGVWEHFDEHGNVTRVEYSDDPYGRGRFGAVPASEAEIARLPKATAGEVREKDCPVCMESFQEGGEIRKMTCPGSHCFHEGCILGHPSGSGLDGLGSVEGTL